MTEQENKEAFDNVMAFIDGMKPPAFLEWWRVENTGWSNGRSWFQCGTSLYDPYRAGSEAEAIEYIERQKKSWNDPEIKWRYVHVTLERNENRSVTTEVWTEI
jgi:hypothetical protein